MTNVAILGAGPSGMIACHAALNHGASEVQVYSAPVGPSPIWGAQYLHMPVPKVPGQDDPFLIRYIHEGMPEEYLRKVYGKDWDGTINDEMRTQEHLGWDIRRSYLWLYEQYEEALVPYTFSREHMETALRCLTERYDLVINTLPRNVLCMENRHQFKQVRIYAIGDTTEYRAPFRAEEGTIVYDGTTNHSWYRAATIQGFSTVEWPISVRTPPVEGVAGVAKPLGHACDCWSEMSNLKHMGRMGRWQNGILAHHVYPATMEALRLLHGA